MNLFKRKQEAELVVVETAPTTYDGINPLTVSVPEIKDYLVREFERTEGLQKIIDDLEEKLEIANETSIKYDAAMVTIDGYRKRLDDAEDRIFKVQEKLDTEKQKHSETRDTLNSFKIRLNDAALTKSQIKNEIIREIKGEIVSAIKSHKGALSKTSACEIVNRTKLPTKGDKS